MISYTSRAARRMALGRSDAGCNANNAPESEVDDVVNFHASDKTSPSKGIRTKRANRIGIGENRLKSSNLPHRAKYFRSPSVPLCFAQSAEVRASRIDACDEVSCWCDERKG